MNNAMARSVDLFTMNAQGGIVISSFCTERGALRGAEGEGRYVIAVLGRVISWVGVTDPNAWIAGRPTSADQVWPADAGVPSTVRTGYASK